METGNRSIGAMLGVGLAAAMGVGAAAQQDGPALPENPVTGWWRVSPTEA